MGAEMRRFSSPVQDAPMNDPGKVPLGDTWKEIRHIIPSIFQCMVSPFSAPGAQRGTTSPREPSGPCVRHWFRHIGSCKGGERGLRCIYIDDVAAHSPLILSRLRPVLPGHQLSHRKLQTLTLPPPLLAGAAGSWPAVFPSPSGAPSWETVRTLLRNTREGDGWPPAASERSNKSTCACWKQMGTDT